MAPGLPWKLFVGPGLFLGLKFANVDYQSPQNLIVVRVLYGLSQVFLFGFCAFIFHRIRDRGDEKKTLKLVTPAPSSSGEESKETKVTFKEYDIGELKKLAKNFALGAAVTLGIHVYMQVVPALILQIVTQPITLIEHPLFQIYVLSKDPAEDSKLKRPFADKSPAARLEAMQKELKQKELEGQRNQSTTQSLTEGGSTSQETSVDTATGGNAQTSVTTTERRSRRPSTAEE